MKAREKKKTDKVSFRLLAPQVKCVSLAGDFNDWDPMKKDKKGTWSVNLHLYPGAYQYGFLVDTEGGIFRHAPIVLRIRSEC